MSWSDIAPYIKDIAMTATLVVAWFIGRERRMLDHNIKELVQKEVKAVLVAMVTTKDLDLLEARLLRVIDQAASKAKHEAISDERVAGKILELSNEIDLRFQQLADEVKESIAEIRHTLQNATIVKRRV